MIKDGAAQCRAPGAVQPRFEAEVRNGRTQNGAARSPTSCSRSAEPFIRSF